MIHQWSGEPQQSGWVCVFRCVILTFQTESLCLQAFVKDLSKPHVLSDGLSIYRRLQSDDQDSVRLLTVEDLVVIAQQLSPAEVKEQLLKQIRQSISDKSWRVRYMAANHFNGVSVSALGPSINHI